jgi:phosphonate transport system substrate-binding protein
MKFNRMAVILLIGLMALGVVVTGCGNNSNASGDTSAPSGWPEVIKYSMVPGEGAEMVAKTAKPIAEDLGKFLGIKVEVFTPTDYTSVIEAMRTKNLDIAEFGPFSYIIAHDRSGAEAFAVAAKSPEEAFYNSYIIVPGNSTAKTLDDLRGKKFLFVDPASTSGNLFPHYMLAKHFGLSKPEDVDKLFSAVSFSGSHDASILAVSKGDADGAGVSNAILTRMIESGQIKESDVKILKKSDPIPIDPTTYRSDLPDDLKAKIKEFFLSYNNEELFKERGINGYFEIEDSNYDVVRDVADTLKMNPDDLLK